MTDGNGKSGLAYVLRDMEAAQTRMDGATLRLQAARMPDFTACPAGGEEYHAAMADASHAQSEGIGALLQWQAIQVRREMERANGQRHDRAGDQPEIRTKWFSARGAAAMWPAVVFAVVVVIVLILKG